jgi:hypothetical protein
MRDSFAPPDKDFHARMQLKHVRQLNSSTVQYVRRVRALIASLAHEPPSPKEQLLALFDGLSPAVKQAAMVDPRTGKFWDDFEALASHVITLETHAHTKSPAKELPASQPAKRPFVFKGQKRVGMMQGKKGGHKQEKQLRFQKGGRGNNNNQGPGPAPKKQKNQPDGELQRMAQSAGTTAANMAVAEVMKQHKGQGN